MSKSDGGCAFPSHIVVSPQGDVYTSFQWGGEGGMTLRDAFAMEAMGKITANDFALNNYIPSQIADWSYQMADAMLAERDKK